MSVFRKTRSRKDLLKAIHRAMGKCEREFAQRAQKSGDLRWLVAKEVFKVKMVIANGDADETAVEKECAWCFVFLDRRKSPRTCKQAKPVE